jgi:hypothetical protein
LGCSFANIFATDFNGRNSFLFNQVILPLIPVKIYVGHRLERPRSDNGANEAPSTLKTILDSAKSMAGHILARKVLAARHCA